MTPILYPNNEKEFKSEGLGRLSDAISCKVLETLNGAYELEVEYPMSGQHFNEICDRSIIFAKPTPYDDPQPFRVYRVTKPMNGLCTVYAKHLTYDLSGIPLRPFTAVSAADAMAKLKSNAIVANDFKFTTNLQTAANMSLKVPTSTRAALGGTQGSVLDTYGGEYQWDKWTVKLLTHRGNDNGVVIRYGKNLIDLEQDRNISNVKTGIIPFWASEDKTVTSNPEIINAPGTYDFDAVVPVDFSSDFEEAPTPEQLAKRGERYVKENRVGIPKVSLKVEFAQLEQMEGYEGLQYLERVRLGDIVTVLFEDLGIDVKAKIIKTTSDVLRDRYIEVEIGEPRASITNTIATNAQEIAQRPTSTVMDAAINQATAWITGENGGYVIFKKNLDGQPYEILIMDTPEITTATKVWRWNQSGLGYSKNGYNGPYELALTQDGAFVASFITVGVLKAIRIESADGDSYWDLAKNDLSLNGTFTAKSAGGNLTMSENSITMTDANKNLCYHLWKLPGYYGAIMDIDGSEYRSAMTSDGILIAKKNSDGTETTMFTAGYLGNAVVNQNLSAGSVTAKTASVAETLTTGSVSATKASITDTLTANRTSIGAYGSDLHDGYWGEIKVDGTTITVFRK